MKLRRPGGHRYMPSAKHHQPGRRCAVRRQPAVSAPDRRSEKLRRFFAEYVTSRGGAREARIKEAFAAIEREIFAGPGPWFIYSPGCGYLTTPDDDPTFLYQDTLVAIDAERGINMGEPTLHARCLEALALRPGETVLQVGAGVGYYTAILAYLVGPQGRVYAFEIESDLAARARQNLHDWPWVNVRARSGIAGRLPKADAVYVNAGITQPSRAWLDALRPAGRLLFPLQPLRGFGAMLLIARPHHGEVWPARFVTEAQFIPCVGEQNEGMSRRLMDAFHTGTSDRVRSFRTDGPADDTCWFRGNGWWLSTAMPDGPKIDDCN